MIGLFVASLFEPVGQRILINRPEQTQQLLDGAVTDEQFEMIQAAGARKDSHRRLIQKPASLYTVSKRPTTSFFE